LGEQTQEPALGLQYAIDGECRVVRLTYSGEVTFADWTATMTAVFESPVYRPGFRFLLDRRLALSPQIDYVKRAVEFTRAHRRRVVGSRWAVVVSNSSAFGMARFGQDLAKGLVKDVLVCKDMADAENWLRSD